MLWISTLPEPLRATIITGTFRNATVATGQRFYTPASPGEPGASTVTERRLTRCLRDAARKPSETKQLPTGGRPILANDKPLNGFSVKIF